MGTLSLGDVFKATQLNCRVKASAESALLIATLYFLAMLFPMKPQHMCGSPCRGGDPVPEPCCGILAAGKGRRGPGQGSLIQWTYHPFVWNTEALIRSSQKRHKPALLSVCPMHGPSLQVPSRVPSATSPRNCPQLLSEGKCPHTDISLQDGWEGWLRAGPGGEVKEPPPGPGPQPTCGQGAAVSNLWVPCDPLPRNQRWGLKGRKILSLMIPTWLPGLDRGPWVDMAPSHE